jgi:hypothetical protein
MCLQVACWLAEFDLLEPLRCYNAGLVAASLVTLWRTVGHSVEVSC